MLKALPGQFLAAGHSNKAKGAHVRFAAGEGVGPAAAKRLQAYLDEPAFTILSAMPRNAEAPWPPFIEELRTRNYDIASFRFSVFLRGTGPVIPRRPGVPQQRPGVLAARWGREVHDTTPDIISFWAHPCRSGDSRCFQALLSSSTACHDEFARMSMHHFTTHPTMLDRMRDLGFDKRTLRLSVRSFQQPTA